MKALIFDSGPLINFSMNGLLEVLERLHKQFEGKFIITEQVKQEIVDHPSHIKQFELGALRLAELIDKKVLEMPESLNISQQEVDHETRQITDQANHVLQTEGHWISIVSDAEMSCFALAHALKKRQIDSLLVIDERTARMLAEKPENLATLMSQKLHKNVIQADRNLAINDCKIVRSPELVYIAYKKGLTDLHDGRALEALLYATKFKGAAISFEELEELKRL